MNLQCHQRLHHGDCAGSMAGWLLRLHSRLFPEALAPATEEAGCTSAVTGSTLAGWGLLPRGLFPQKVKLK